MISALSGDAQTLGTVKRWVAQKIGQKTGFAQRLGKLF